MTTSSHCFMYSMQYTVITEFVWQNIAKST